jgi:hypothetical protein
VGSPEFWNFLNIANIPVVIYKTVLVRGEISDMHIYAFNEAYRRFSGGLASVGLSINYLPRSSVVYFVKVFKKVLDTNRPMILENYVGPLCPDIAGTAMVFPVSLHNTITLGFIHIPHSLIVDKLPPIVEAEQYLLEEVEKQLATAKDLADARLRVSHLRLLFDVLGREILLRQDKTVLTHQHQEALTITDAQKET